MSDEAVKWLEKGQGLGPLAPFDGSNDPCLRPMFEVLIDHHPDSHAPHCHLCTAQPSAFQWPSSGKPEDWTAGNGWREPGEELCNCGCGMTLADSEDRYLVWRYADERWIC